MQHLSQRNSAANPQPRREIMRIVQSPYQARIVPQSAGAPNLWRCVIEQEDSREVVVLHETARKEDARCMALLELARLESTGAPSRPSSRNE
jgi:hypothetical protein